MFDIISMGDYSLLAEAFNGLAMIFGSSPVSNMMKVAFLVGILMFGARASLYNKWDATPLLAGFIAYLCMFGPKVTVTVTDGYSGAVRVVANVPIGIAAPMAITSHTGRYFAYTFEQAFSVIQPGSAFYTEGYLNAIEVLLKMRAPDLGWASVTSDSRVESTLINYLRDCVYLDLAMSDPGNANEVDAEKLANSKETWAALKTTFLNIYTNDYLNTLFNQPQQLSCKEVYERLDQKISSPGTWLTTYYDTYLQSLMGASRQAFSASADARIGSALSAINLSAADSRTWMLNTMLSTALRNADAAYQVGQGNVAGTVMITQAATQRNAKWIAEKGMFEQVARPITAFIELFMVGAAPIMAFAVAAFGHVGFGLLGKFLMMHVWVTLWIPCTALVNAYMAHTLASFVEWTQVEKGIELLSQAGLNQLNMQLQTQYATGGMLAAAVPMLTLMLIYGTSQVFTSMASKMGGADYVDPKQVAPNIVDAGPIVSQASSWTQNPGTLTQQRTGVALPVASIGSTLESGASYAKTLSAQKAAEASDMFNRHWGFSESSTDRVGFSTDGRMSGTGTYSQGLAAVYNRALAAAQEAGMSGSAATNYARSVGDSYRAQTAMGASGGVGTGDAMPFVQAGVRGSQGWTDEAAETAAKSMGVTTQQLRSANLRFNNGASKDQRIAAGFEESKGRSEVLSNGHDWSTGHSKQSSRALSSVVRDTQSAAQTYQQLNAAKSNLGLSANAHPTQLLTAYKSAFGAGWSDRLGQDWQNFHSNLEPDQAQAARDSSLKQTRDSGMFKGSTSSVAGEQAALEKLWAMLSQPTSAPAFMQSLGRLAGVDTGSVGASDPSSWAGNVPQNRLHARDVWNQAGEAQPQGQAVQDGAEAAIGSRKAQAASWKGMLDNKFSPESVKSWYQSKLGPVEAAEGTWRSLALDMGSRAFHSAGQDGMTFLKELKEKTPEQLKNDLIRFMGDATPGAIGPSGASPSLFKAE